MSGAYVEANGGWRRMPPCLRGAVPAVSPALWDPVIVDCRPPAEVSHPPTCRQGLAGNLPRLPAAAHDHRRRVPPAQRLT